MLIDGKDIADALMLISPVSGAVASVVAPRAVVRSSPGNGGTRPATNFTPQSHSIAALASYIGDRDEEFWRSCGVREDCVLNHSFFPFFRNMQYLVKWLF